MARIAEKTMTRALPGRARVPKHAGFPMGIPEQDPYSSREGQLEREYNRLLIERGISIRRKDLKKLDRIDVRGICAMPPDKYNFPLEVNGLPDGLVDEYLVAESGSQGFLHCILPCFAEGVMQLNANLELYWKVLGTDMEAQIEDVELRLFHDEGFGWAPTVIVRARIKAPEKAEEIPFILHAFGADAVRIPWDAELPGWGAVHHAIPAQDLPWNGKDKALWQEFVRKTSDVWPDDGTVLFQIDDDGSRKKSEIGPVAGLAKIWAGFVLVVNILLWARTHAKKAVGSDGWERKAAPVAKGKVEGKQEETGKPKRAVRTVGGISLTSEKPPRRVTAKGARNYKVAEWKRRGHPRHYKSGKVIWIEESTAHRRATKVADAEALPVTIRVRGEKG